MSLYSREEVTVLPKHLGYYLIKILSNGDHVRFTEYKKKERSGSKAGRW